MQILLSEVNELKKGKEPEVRVAKLGCFTESNQKLLLQCIEDGTIFCYKDGYFFVDVL